VSFFQPKPKLSTSGVGKIFGKFVGMQLMIGVGENSVFSLQTFEHAGADFCELHWWTWSEWWDA